MLAIAISLLFGLAAFAALVVIHVSARHALVRAPQIAAELAMIERLAGRATQRRRMEALPPLFAAA